MNIKTIILGLIPVVSSFVLSCSRLEEPHIVYGSGKVFYGETPAKEAGTKTFIDCECNIYWYAGDSISVFRSAVNEKYQFSGREGEIKNEFHKMDASVTGSPYSRNYAVYPYSAGTSSPGEGHISISLPSVQHYVQDSFGQNANTMVAATGNYDDDVFYFKNVCGFLMLKIYGGDTIRRINVSGNNGEKIAGNGTITWNGDGIPGIEMAGDATTQITLDCGEEGVETSADANEYKVFWVVLPPTDFTKGFTVEINTAGGTTKTMSTAKSLSVAKNTVKRMAAVKCNTQHSHELISFSLTNGTETYPAYDISNGYVNIMVPNQTNLSDMAAVFTYDGASVKVGEEEQTSGISRHDFSDFAHPLSYRVTGADGSLSNYIIRLFDLPVIYINTPYYQPITSKYIWIDGASIKIRNTDNTELDLGVSAIKGRGNVSWTYPKKPYTIKLQQKQSVLGMPKDKRWNLMACYHEGYFKNPFLFEFGRRTSLGWHPYGKYVELILNGEHLGLFWICEKIKIASNKINITEISSEDISEETRTGGYLLEMDDNYNETYRFRSQYYDMPVMLQNPNENVPQVQFDYIQGYVNEFEHCLHDSTLFQNREYLNYVDIEGFIDIWFAHEIGEIDDNIKRHRGFFLYKDRGKKMKVGPLWDMARAFENDKHGWFATPYLYNKMLLKDPEYVKRAIEKWYGTIEDPGIIKKMVGLNSYLDSLYNTVFLSDKRNTLMWPYSGFTKGGAREQRETLWRRYNISVDWINANLQNLYEMDEKNGNNEDFNELDDKTGSFIFTD